MQWNSKTYSKLHMEMCKGFAETMRGILLTVKPSGEQTTAQNPHRTDTNTAQDILGEVWEQHLGTLCIKRKVSLEGTQHTTIPDSTTTEVCIDDPWSQDHVLIIPKETAEKILVLGCPAPPALDPDDCQYMREFMPLGLKSLF